MRTETRRRTSPAPSFDRERRLRAQGYRFIAGLDEVGRGPLAGPVTAAAVVLPLAPDPRWADLIRDSKQLTPAQRRRLAPILEQQALAVGVGQATPREIDEAGIVAATQRAMGRALARLPLTPDFLLLDAFPLPGVLTPQQAIVHGDALCLSIAAASIVAKVHRDQLMGEADAMYPGYGFARHKGYPSPEHLRRLRELGPCAIHRRSFAPVGAVLDRPRPPAAPPPR